LPPPPPPPAKCSDGSFANAYGLCRTTVVNPCGPGFVARGNFCLPLTPPSCGPGTTPTAVAGGGVLCLPQRTACGLRTHLADGRCVPDFEPCGPGEMRNSANQCVKNIVVPTCGLNALNVGGRCTPADPRIPITPVGITVGVKNPDLRHPSLPIIPITPVTPVRPLLTPTRNFPTKLVDTGPKNNNPYVIGRGGHGLNLYNPSNQGSSSPGKTTSNKIVPFRTGAQPILHGLPTMGSSKNTILR
jgi:hypothetical protein